MIDLWKIKENFSSLVVETEPWTLAQFVMWLDLKISEYKIKGFMVLDHQNSTRPRWMSPDDDTDPGTDVAPQLPPCRKCNKGDNSTWEPYRISHKPPTNYVRSREYKQENSGTHREDFITTDQSRASNRSNFTDANFNSDIQVQNRGNTAVIDLEKLPETSVYISDNISEQSSSHGTNEIQSSGKSDNTYRNKNPTAMGFSARNNSTVSHLPSSSQRAFSNSDFMHPSTNRKQIHTTSSSSNSIQIQQGSSQVQSQPSHPVQTGIQKPMVEVGAKKGDSYSGQEGEFSEGVVPLYLHSNLNNNDNQQYGPRETTPTFVLSEVKQEDLDSTMADISGFDEDMLAEENDNSRTSYSDDEQGSSLDQNPPQEGATGRPRSTGNRHSGMSFAASVVELPTFEDPLVRRVLEDSSTTPSRHMWSKIITRCAYHLLSKGVPLKNDYQAFSEAFYHRYPCVGTSRGPHPWSTLAGSVSQKVRNIRFRRKHDEYFVDGTDSDK